MFMAYSIELKLVAGLPIFWVSYGMTAIYIPAWPSAFAGALYHQSGMACLWQGGLVVWQSGKYLPL
jgi:hypothetical protein